MSDQNLPPIEDDPNAPQPRFTPRSPRALIEPDLPPPPPVRSKRARHSFIAGMNSFFSFILILGLLVFAGIYFVKHRLIAEGPLTQDMALVIPPRTGMVDMSKMLEKAGIISNPLNFQAGVILKRGRGKLKAGEYLFPAHASTDDVIDIIAEGKSVLHPVTIPEGLTSQQIVQRLMNYDVLTGQVTQIPPEGTLLPDTYNVQRGTSRQKILDKMSAAQQKFVAGLVKRKPANAPYADERELVTLASIVEKETGKAEERPRVAAVFINRLKRGMKLQSDPTTIYGIVGGKGVQDKPLTRADLARPTPYNTYVIEKLPPTPIANPGRLALEAVVAPLNTNDLYFVADGTGGHVFAATLSEHTANVAKWRQIQRQRGETPEPESTTPPSVEPAVSGRQNQAPSAEEAPATNPANNKTGAKETAPAANGKVGDKEKGKLDLRLD